MLKIHCTIFSSSAASILRKCSGNITYFPCPAGSHSMPYILLSCIKLAEFEKPGICKYPNPIIQKSLQKILSPFQYFSRCYFLWAKLLQFSWIYTAYCASKVKAELGKFSFMEKSIRILCDIFQRDGTLQSS